MQVEVYKNLRKKTWSVRKKGLVQKHPRRLTLRSCTFKVLPGGHARFKRTGVRNVHAFVKGTPARKYWDCKFWVVAHYDLKKGQFIEKWSERPLKGARYVVFDYPDIYAGCPEYA